MQQSVAEGFEVQSSSVHLVIVQIVRILDAISWVIIACLLVGVGHDNMLVQCLQRPIVFHEVPSEVIEQLGMCGIHGAQAKFVE